MSKISQLAQDFEQSVKQQREATQQAVSSELNELQKHLKRECETARQKIELDIQNNSRRKIWPRVIGLIGLSVIMFSLGLLAMRIEGPRLVSVVMQKDGSEWIQCKEVRQTWCKIK